MFFKKKKDMVELGEVQRRNVNLPNGRKFVAKDGAGFVDLTKKSKLPSQMRAEKLSRVNAPASAFASDSPSGSSESASAFSFFDSPVSNSFSPSSSSGGDSETDDMLRKISIQISDLDTKLYKMEQRIEVLERKAGVGAGW